MHILSTSPLIFLHSASIGFTDSKGEPSAIIGERKRGSRPDFVNTLRVLRSSNQPHSNLKYARPLFSSGDGISATPAPHRNPPLRPCPNRSPNPFASFNIFCLELSSIRRPLRAMSLEWSQMPGGASLGSLTAGACISTSDLPRLDF